MNKITRSYRRNRARAARIVRAAQDRLLGPRYLKLPIQEDVVVYTCVWHRAPRGNPLAIYRKHQEIAPHLKAVWIVRKQDAELVPPGIEFVTPRTLDYLKLISTAKYFVDDANPHWSVPPRDGQVYVETHHGTALKYMGADRHYSGKRPTDQTIVTMHNRCQRWTYSLSTSPYLTEVWRRAYNNRCAQLPVGSPRNDRLIHATADERMAARERLGLAPDEQALLYMPTWRTRRGPKEADFDLSSFAALLPDGVRLLVRDHYYHDKRGRKQIPESVIDVSRGWEVEDLYLASDALITDYSSAMFDYALLNKPILLFCFDWDRYRFERGAYFDITVDAPGQVTYNANGLLDAVRTASYTAPEYEAARESFRARFCTYENGNAAELVVRKVLLGEDVVSPEPPTEESIGSTVKGWTPHPRVMFPEDPSLEERLPPAPPTLLH